MKITFGIVFCIFLSFSVRTQTTYYQDVKPIITTHCLPCHSNKNLGPMPLDNYYSVKAFANMIHEVVVAKIMPPYQLYLAECNDQIKSNSLSDDEISTIKNWISHGFTEGEKVKEEKRDTSPSSDSIIVFSMEKSFEVKINKEEHTQIFVIPFDQNEDVYTNKIQFFPSNKELVISAFVFIDTTEECIKLDKMDLKYGYTNYSSVAFKPMEYAWYGWNPYDNVLILKAGYLKKIPAHSKILLQVTYKPYHKAYLDSTSCLKVWIKNKSTNDKIIHSNFIIDSTHLLLKPFMLYKNDLKIIKAERIVDQDMEIHTITPFGQNVLSSWSIYFIDENNKKQPLVNIPQWDIHWKKVYNFKQPISIKKGSKIVAEASYNFTEENIRIPIIPLGRVPYGEGPKNELFLVAMDVSFESKIH